MVKGDCKTCIWFYPSTDASLPVLDERSSSAIIVFSKVVSLSVLQLPYLNPLSPRCHGRGLEWFSKRDAGPIAKRKKVSGREEKNQGEAPAPNSMGGYETGPSLHHQLIPVASQDIVSPNECHSKVISATPQTHWRHLRRTLPLTDRPSTYDIRYNTIQIYAMPL